MSFRRSSPGSSLPSGLQEPQRVSRFESGENRFDALAEMVTDQLSEYGAIIGGDSQVALLEKLFGLQPWPLSVNLPAVDGPTENEHDAAVSVIGAVVSVFGCRASELRHRYQRNVLHAIAHVPRKCGQRISELIEQPRQLARLVAVVIPTTDFRKRGFHA